MADSKPNGVLDDASSKAPAGIIIPPAGVKTQIEKAAGYVARNGAQFEERLKTGESKVKVSFVFDDDPYNAYYRWRLEEIKAGRGNAISAGRENEAAGSGGTGVSSKGREERKGPDKPEEFVFSARMPNISAQDLEIVKLTAVFVAKNGRSWMTNLSQKEAGNFQFDFLRPQHSLYQFFTRLVDQYSELLQGESVDGGRPQKKRIGELEANVENKFRVLEKAKKRAEYVKWQEAQKVAKEESEEKEKIAFQQIDWHDFVVVETVTFDERDAEAQLPPPTTLNDLQSASLEQKAKMSINPNMRLEEAFPSFDDNNGGYGATAQQQQQYQTPYTPPVPQLAWQPPPGAEDQAGRLAELRMNQDRARLAQEAARTSTPQQKIRTDYVPRAAAQQKSRQPPGTSLCPNCGQFIPDIEIAEHMRIEMLDPQWRDQNRIAVQRSSTTNLSMGEVANNLRRLASQRGDVFDSAGGGTGMGEEEERRKRAMLEGGVGVPGGQVQGQGQGAGGDVQEQIRQLHQRYRG
ncbi:SF3a splicing factor complex subunit [Recurvomyces mirabilis]|nr:SF3a splicing factor complex subunit [Recurvomyces mirabilis]